MWVRILWVLGLAPKIMSTGLITLQLAFIFKYLIIIHIMKTPILLLALVVISLATRGVDVATAITTATFTCMKNSGISFAIMRAYRSPGAIDTNAATTLTNAKAAGLSTDIYMFPCRGKSATTQVNQMFSAVSANLYGMIWLDIETNPSSGCSWTGHDAASNCAFVTELVNAAKAKGKNVGIYSSATMWTSILGSRTACPAVGSQPLWYAHYDNVQAFSDFSSFGGWTKPYMKQYQGDVTLCSTDVDFNWLP